jgi:hypothetical protein
MSTSGTVSGLFSGGFTLNSGSPHGYVHIYTNSSTAYTGSKPFANEQVSVVGTGSYSAGITATNVTQSTSSTATPTPAPVTTAAPTTGNVIWKAGDPTLGKWIVGNTYQCGTPVNTGSTFTFNLVKNGTNCGRNQMLPVTSSGSTVYLTDGKTYTWSFHYVDGKPDGTGPGMGQDTGSDPESLIWQIHGNTEPDTPCTSLNFLNGSYYSGSLGAGQQWGFMTCSGVHWYGKYTPGEVDDFKIVATIANADIASETYGDTKLYRNGVLVMDTKGPNYHHSTSSPARSWFNFGPYKWRWELANGGGSSMSNVNATIENMVVTQQ